MTSFEALLRRHLLEENDIVLISEWPITDSNLQNQTVDSVVQSITRTELSSFLSINENADYEKRIFFSQGDSCIDYKDISHSNKKQKLIHRPICRELKEPFVSVRVAKWLRRNSIQLSADPKATSPNTKLFNVSRSEQCVQFLKEERDDLLRKCSMPDFNNRDDIHAALASIEDWLQNYNEALVHIKHAIASSPDNKEYLWLKKKLKRQCNVQQYQIQKLKAIKNMTPKLPDFIQVERVSCKELTVEDFTRCYVDRRQPVIIVDLLSEITNKTWDFEFVKSIAGSLKVTVKQAVPKSVEWAQLEDSRTVVVAEFIEAVQKNETSEYLFDWSLPLHCPDLAKEFVIPNYFDDNFLLKTSPGSLYRDSWPSLFIAPKGVNSNLHVDAFASNFWMVLFQGQKRWTFFDADDAPLLYPVYFHSMDPVFSVDLSQPDVETFPLFSLTKPRQCILNPGELLFVPSGSPHYVENLTSTLALSSNYVSWSNYTQVCKELKINSLNDPRSQDLLQQLENPAFTNNRLRK
ncbi:uncharacterized protein LOC106063319 isoform X1 [Biomphalaria glabrata]|uniref:Uncharacterized protein LOC106063319 isoform X1 n=2 Tax=Biomphalaria glabrata TaxID=6526 RepID=A0A9U8E7W2_BIOGL|nr:uncharacterized protein LOC106063319 isoform X1 [Biomphalaria glabrata]